MHWFFKMGVESPLVLLHGFAGLPESFDSVVSYLKPKRSVAGIKLPGHGLGAVPFDESFDGIVDKIAQWLLATNMRGLHVCGYSLGARVAVALLVRYPSLFSRATLIGATAGIQSKSEAAVRRESDAILADRIVHEGMAWFADYWQEQAIFASQRTAPLADRERQQAIRRAHEPAALACALRCLGQGAMPNYWPLLSQIVCPVDVVVGDGDVKYQLLARALAEGVMRGRMVVVPGCGHNPTFEMPSAVAALLDLQTL